MLNSCRLMRDSSSCISLLKLWTYHSNPPLSTCYRKSGHGNHIKVECVASDILAEGCCCLVSREDVDEVEEKPKDIIQFSAKKLSVDEVSQLVISLLCGAVSLFVGEFVMISASSE